MESVTHFCLHQRKSTWRGIFWWREDLRLKRHTDVSSGLYPKGVDAVNKLEFTGILIINGTLDKWGVICERVKTLSWLFRVTYRISHTTPLLGNGFNGRLFSSSDIWCCIVKFIKLNQNALNIWHILYVIIYKKLKIFFYLFGQNVATKTAIDIKVLKEPPLISEQGRMIWLTKKSFLAITYGPDRDHIHPLFLLIHQTNVC